MPALVVLESSSPTCSTLQVIDTSVFDHRALASLLVTLSTNLKSTLDVVAIKEVTDLAVVSSSIVVVGFEATVFTSTTLRR